MTFADAFAQFHFLRPGWLLGLALLPLIWIALRKRVLAGSDWAAAIDPQLLKHLTPSDKQQKRQSFHTVMIWSFGLTFIAMAGPTWQEKPQPVIKVTDNMVVILDLSLSMLATDTAPDRLTRTKQKLRDLLQLRKEGNTALIVFSGDAHVVTPLTDDTNTIIANLPALDPFIMPVIGSRPDLAVEQALQLLDQGKAQRGRIVMLTDGVEEHQQSRIREALNGRNVQLNVLAVGTAAGGPINLPERGYLKDGDRVVIPKTDFDSLNTLATANAGTMHPMTLDAQDLGKLDIEGSNILSREDDETAIDRRFDTWEDMGYLLLLALIPLLLLAHRQGVIIALVLFVIPVENSHAFDWNDLWQTPDQQAQVLMDQGAPEQAAEVFESTEHKAHARFKAKQYQQASESYAQSDTDDGHYNRGNALAYQQKFEEALEAYDAALEKNPAHEDALYNKQRILEFLEQQQQNSESDSQSDPSEQNEQNQQNQQNQDSSGQNEQSQDKDQSQDQDQSDSKSQQSDQSDQNDQKESEQQQEQDSEQQQNSESDQQEQQQEQDAQQQSEQTREPQQAAQQGQAEAMPEQLSDEEKQSYEQWMRRVPDDPGGLLRRKFEQQARDRNRQSREQGEPLW